MAEEAPPVSPKMFARRQFESLCKQKPVSFSKKTLICN